MLWGQYYLINDIESYDDVRLAMTRAYVGVFLIPLLLKVLPVHSLYQ
jgi:hypothetical protein